MRQWCTETYGVGTLHRADDARCRRPQERIPRARVRGRRQALRAGARARSREPLYRRTRRNCAAAQARRRCLAEGKEEGRAEDSRHRRGAARSLLPASCAPRRTARCQRARSTRLRGAVPLRRNAGSGTSHRASHRRSRQHPADGSRRLRRRRFRQDGGRIARSFRRRAGGQASGRARADHPSRATALPKLRRSFRRLARARRVVIALSQHERGQPSHRRSRIGTDRHRRRYAPAAAGWRERSAASGSSSSTKSTASASRTRSASRSCGPRSTC